MARAGGNLGVWGTLVLLGLSGCTVVRAADPVRNLRVEAQDNSSISLTWDVPEGSYPSQNLTYWAQCTEDGGQSETRNTTDTRVTIDGLCPASSYECSVWVERDGVSSSKVNLSHSTAPNPVRNLRVEAQDNSSISLTWDVPENSCSSSSQDLTYWAQCTADGGQNKTKNTTDTSVTVDGLCPASSYECSVWVERDGVSSSKVTLNQSTAPNPVRNLRVETQDNSSISLTWDVPEGSSPSQDLTYWAQCTEDGGQNKPWNTTDTRVTVPELRPASSYECSVWVERDGVSSSKVTLNQSTAPNPVRNLRVETQDNSSISLTWDVPEGSSPSQDLTYWAQCTEDGGQNKPWNTTDTRVTVPELRPASSYECSVWVERDGVSSSKVTLNQSTAPNPVRNLRVETQDNSSISLTWDVPEGSSPSQDLTYWAQCTEDGGQNKPWNTTDTRVTVPELRPASSYECSVWVERDGVSSSKVTLNQSTAPNPVRNLRVETQDNSSISLTWDVPEGSSPSQDLTYLAQCTEDGGQNKPWNTTDTRVTVPELRPASSYECSVWVERDGVSSSKVTLNQSTAPNPVRNLRVETQDNSSISLTWDVPEGSSPSQDLTYWAQCTEDGGQNKPWNTTDTRVTVPELRPASSYECSVWVERDGVSSSKVTLNQSTAPNPVRNLRVETQDNSSISLTWDVPEGSSPSQDLTYWAQCTEDGGQNKPWNTTDTRVTVPELRPASSYECSVWVERDGVSSSKVTLNQSTAPNPVRNLRVETQDNSSISLTWDVPEGSSPSQDLTYWAQCTEDGGQNKPWNTTDTRVTVPELRPASSYECSVWVERDGVSSSKVTLNQSTAPNPVRNLRVEAQDNSSISLTWDVPENSCSYSSQDLTYLAQCTEDGGHNEPRNTTETRVIVHELRPASSYECSVWVERDGVSSSKVTVRHSTAPNPVRNLRVETQDNSSISLTWDVPEGSSPSQDLTYWAQCTEDGGQNKPWNTKDTRVTVPELRPASSYECSVWVERDGVSSSKVTLNQSTAPNPVRNLRVETQDNSSISLTWDVPEGSSPSQDLTYWAQCTEDGGQNKPWNTKDTRVTVPELRPASSYECSVWVERDGVNNSKVTVSHSTAPNPVINLFCVSQTNNSITWSWERPQDPDLQGYTYRVRCTGEHDKNETRRITNTSITFEELEAGTLYNFSVWAQKNGIPSSLETLSNSTAPNEVTDLQNKSHTNSSVTLIWSAPEDRYSHNYTYWVQWASEEEEPQGKKDTPGSAANFKDSTNESRYEVKSLRPGTLYNFSVWAERSHVSSSIQHLQAPTAPDPVNSISCVSTSGGYGVILTWSCPSEGYETFEVEVGRQWISRNGSFCNKGVSVSDLGPAQSYMATITTVSNGLRAPSISVTCYTESAGVIVGAIIGILLLFILVGLLIFFLKRRRRKKSQQKDVPKDLVFSFPGDILAKDFADYVRENEKDSNYGFAKEYQQLALEGQGQSQMTASALENISKNRYRNVLPYDSSRVPLKPLHEEPGSDYINASFIPGLWSPKEFIATQGPLPHTVGDFWRLVWEQQSHTLVMLTNCMESGRVKCEHYWPLDARPCMHGQLQVTVVNEDVKENWTVRDLQLFHVGEKQTLSVRQFHYLAWPDHGVPYSPEPLLAFQKVLRQWVDQTMDGGPPIVHCSAGVGRTGTLIALDVLLRQLECEGLVGPFSFVKKMRESRPLMVQTEAQYVFLHQCILRYLQQSAPDLILKETTYENVSSFIYENAAAIRAHESEASATGC